MREKQERSVKKVPAMKRTKAKSIMVDCVESNPRKGKGMVLTRTLRGVRK
jgi:hypothetical protein